VQFAVQSQGLTSEGPALTQQDRGELIRDKDSQGIPAQQRWYVGWLCNKIKRFGGNNK